MDQVFTIHMTASRFPSPPAAQEPTGHPTIGMKLLMLRCKQKPAEIWQSSGPSHSAKQRCQHWDRWRNTLCLPFSHALATVLKKTLTTCWEGGKSLKVLGLYGQISFTCLWNDIFSLCAGLCFYLYLSWGHLDPWLKMLNTERGKKFAVNPERRTVVAEHLLKARSAVLHQGGSST